MTEIVRMLFGSHLYGTETAESDQDFKAVFMPSGVDLLMQRAPLGRHQHREKGHGERNTRDDVDDDAYSLQAFMRLLSEGQTGALDMLFAPDWAVIGERTARGTPRVTPTWREIRENRGRLLCRKSEAFIGYCRQQANKYGIKGSRVAAARAARDLLDWAHGARGPRGKLGEIEDRIDELVAATEHMQAVDIEGPTDLSGNRRAVRHWEVCNRKMPYTQTIKEARELMHRLVTEYGRRALSAETNEGVDWKALSHAVRVGHESVELLSTGEITFPRPERAHLLRIKTGMVEYRPVAEEIEDLLVRVEAAAAGSALPAEIDRGWAEALVQREHLREVTRYFDLRGGGDEGTYL
jgi:hypothetical protein